MRRRAQSERRWVWAAAAIVAVAAAFVATVNISYELLIVQPEDRVVRRGWRRIVPGMSEREVVDLLGSPDDRSEVFYLGQREGFEDAYSRAAESRSTYYLVWRREIDVVYAVGFDQEQSVSVKEVGGT